MSALLSEPMSGVIAIGVFGFTGSLHCAGMCGAIAASCSRRGLIRDAATYHLARVLSYSLTGLVLGLIAATLLASFPSLQSFHTRYLGLILGSLMLIYAGFEAAKLLGLLQPSSPSKPWIQRFFRKIPFSEPLILGVATALLPCGFLYAAFLQATVLAHPIYSAAGMFLFAIATGPALGAGGAVFLWFQKRAPLLAPWISAIALLFAGLAIISRSLPNQHTHHHEQHIIPQEDQSPSLPEAHHHP